MSRLTKTLKLAALALALPAAAHAAVLWRGDYETGNLAQWTKYQAQSSSRIYAMTSPVRQGKYALHSEVHYGDLSSSGCRAEVVRGVAETEGNERWFSWSTMFPSSYPLNNTWQVFTQWHHSGSTGSPPLEFDLFNNNVHLTTKGSTILWSAPITFGAWHKFVFHVKFSASSSTGFVELWLDGKKVLPRKMVATLYSGQVNYMKQGIYRNAKITQVGVVYHDGTVEGTTMADVAPELVTTTTALIKDGGDDSLEQPVPDELVDGQTQAELDARLDSALPGPGVTPDPELIAGIDTMETAEQAATGCSSAGASSWAWAVAALGAVGLVRRRRRSTAQTRA